MNKQRGFSNGAALAVIALAAGTGLLVWLQARELDQLKVRHSQAVLHAAEQAAEAAQATARYEKAVAAFNKDTANALAKQEEETHEKLQTLRRAADAERVGRLRADATLAARTRELQDLARRAATGAEREASADAIGMLADVLARADERAGILATVADESRIRGSACEQAFHTVAARINAGMPD